MTPPLIRPIGQAHGGTLQLSVEQARDFQPTPQFQALARSLLSSREMAAEQGRSLLARSLPACRDNPDCHPDLNLLPHAVSQSLGGASHNPALYRMSLNFLAAQFMNTRDEAERTRLQDQARQIARQALDRVSDPSFTPPPEDRQGRELPLRTRARMLFNIASTLSALLARAGAETYSEEDRALLRDYFVRTRSLVEQLRERKRLDPQVLGWPEYFDHFLQAQISLIDGQSSAAFSSLIRTRQILNELPAEAQSMPLPTQIRASTELALQSMPRDGSGLQVEALRNLLSIEALGFVDQNDYLNSHGESSAPQAARRPQALSLVAATYLQAGNSSPDATALLRQIRSQSNAGALRQLLNDRLRSDQALRDGLASVFPGNLSRPEIRERVVGEILELARQSADSILAHSSEEPYRSLFSHDRDARPLAHAIEALNGNAPLLGQLRQTFGIPANAGADVLVRELVTYGENLPALLNTLPPAALNAEGNRVFFRELRQAALGMQGEGMRLNLEQPLLDTVESIHGLAQSDDRHAAAYFAIFSTLRDLDQVGSGYHLPPGLRRVAGNHARQLENFSAGRVFRHLTAPSSLGMLAGGLVLSELAPIWLLRGAPIPWLRNASAEAVVSSGEMSLLVRGGRLTGWGEAFAGLGVGLAMHLGSVGAHVVQARGTNIGEYGQELQNLGLANLALGTLFSMAALGLTTGAGHWLRGRFLPQGGTFSPGGLILRHSGLRLGNWAVGGGSMLLAHGATSAIAGHSAIPTGEQAAEVFLSMALWDVGAVGLRSMFARTRLWRHQVGPYRVDQMVRNRLELILRRNPELRGQRRFLENYLRNQARRPGDFGSTGRSLEEGLIPRIEGRGENRRLVFEAPPRPAAQPEISRTEAARTVMDLTEAQQASVQRMLRSSAFRGEENPDGIHAARQALRERLAAGEANPAVWVRAEIHGQHISFEVLPGEPAAADRANTFRMDCSGKINNLSSEDPVIRAVISAYNVDALLSVPILPPSAGAESMSSPGSEEPTAAHRPPRAQLAPSNGAEPAPSGDATGGEALGGSNGAQGALSVETQAGGLNSAQSGPEGLQPEITAPSQPSAALLGQARRTDQVAAAQAAQSPARPPRRDNTVPFSSAQERRARQQSRPDTPIDSLRDTPEEAAADPAAETRHLSDAESQQLRERLGDALRPDGTQAQAQPQPQQPAQPQPRPSSRPPQRQESEPAMAVRDEEVESIEPMEDNEANFSGLNDDAAEAPHADSIPTVIPPANNPRPVQPPPLPGQRSQGDGSSQRSFLASQRRGSNSATAFQAIRLRVRALAPAPSSSTETLAMQPAREAGYSTFVRELDLFISRLFNAHYDTPLDFDTFDVEINPAGEMHVIDGSLNLRNQEHGWSYFSLRRLVPDPEVMSQVEFLIDQTHFSPGHQRAGWESFLRGAFPPPQELSR